MRPYPVRTFLGLLVLAASALPVVEAFAQSTPPTGSQPATDQRKHDRAIAAASTVGLIGAPLEQGPLLAASLPPLSRTEGRSGEPEALKPYYPHFLLLAFGVLVLGCLAAAIVYSAFQPQDPYIRRLGPSFFFWLGITYLCFLLGIAVVYITNAYGIQQVLPDPITGTMPIAVPWFGALGAVVISLQGVYDFNEQWDPKYNYWHIGRPLFGAVVGIVAFFLVLLTATASGATPQVASPTSSHRTFFYVVAFLVGYREETFRELLKRAVDLILKPGEAPAKVAAVTYQIVGDNRVNPPVIPFGPTPAGTPVRVVVEVRNSGTAPLETPRVVVTATAPAPANTFQSTAATDLVTGHGDVAPGLFRTVEVTFTPAVPGAFAGTLTISGANLSAPRTVPLSGTAP